MRHSDADMPLVPGPIGSTRHARLVRNMIREAMTAVAVVLTAPLWIPCVLENVLSSGETWFSASSELLSLVPGLPGVILRRGFFLITIESCALDISIGFGTILAHRNVKIGRSVYIGMKCTLGMVAIENHVTIGSNVDVLSGRYQHAFDNPSQPIQEQKRAFRQITLGQNSWIGNSSVILDDVGQNCVIGAGSVVVKSIPAGSVAVGNPAIVKRQVAAQSQAGVSGAEAR
jgi:virginiamycin A acetyltransferase